MCSIEVSIPITGNGNSTFAAAQMCEISRSLLPPDKACSIYPGVPVLVAFNDGKQYVCSLFEPQGARYRRQDSVCWVDEGVELRGAERRTGDDSSSIPIVERLTIIQEPLCYFQKIHVDVSLDCSALDLELIEDKLFLNEVIKDLLRPLFFGEDCLITVEEHNGSNFGVYTVLINAVEGSSPYGQISRSTELIIEKIIFLNSKALIVKELGGLSEFQEDLKKSFNSKLHNNILIAGPPGSGKFSLVRGVAREQNRPLFVVRGLEFLKSLPGETEADIRKLFTRVDRFNKLFCSEDNKPILLVKDVDSLCPKLDSQKREDMSNIARISSQFTDLLDQYHQTKAFWVVGTTSNIENLNIKIRRPGRLGNEILIRIPGENQRREILLSILRQSEFKLDDQMVEQIIVRTPGYVGADLELLAHTIQREIAANPSQSQEQSLMESLKKNRPSSLRNSVGIINDLRETLDSIGAMESLKKTLRVSVLGPLQHPEAFRRFGMAPLKGILLYGPPGCAKTTIARCLAAEARMTFLSVSAAEIYSPYVGNAERLISRLFNQARLSAPSIIFLDEIDSLVGNRSSQGTQGNDVHTRVLSTLLIEMDGIGQTLQSTITSSVDSKQILLIAATNRPDMIDDALLRPGRLSKLIHIPAPDPQSREQILKKVTERMPLAEDVQLDKLAALTNRYSGADLKNLCGQAALHAASLDENVQQVSMAHFQHALTESGPSLTSEQIRWYEEFESKHKIAR
ncbi:ribosome biogenesis protein SPATA5L1 [Uranotaenia lowii]|uniref:ribosome biogenesis protein SPATA5L1 n=1 Tax=Uranotaenia lowii TaxID=190385 RepID=UPI00247AB9D0|nr:ribosome biogenesis protein SPATA5L1 [Uranotaenia lowii]